MHDGGEEMVNIFCCFKLPRGNVCIRNSKSNEFGNYKKYLSNVLINWKHIQLKSLSTQPFNIFH